MSAPGLDAVTARQDCDEARPAGRPGFWSGQRFGGPGRCRRSRRQIQSKGAPIKTAASVSFGSVAITRTNLAADTTW